LLPLKSRAESAGLALAEAKYGQKFAYPKVTYDLSGTTAGTADYVHWHIKLNAGLLMRNVDTFIERTVPHELAHLITDRVYPEAHRGRGFTLTSRGYKREKREVHGPKWQSVCYVLGMTDVTRCHSYDTTEAGRKKARYEWQCTGCQKVIQLGPKHNKAQELYGSVHHKGCSGHKLVKPGTAAPAATPASLPPLPPLPKPVVDHWVNTLRQATPAPAAPVAAPKTYGSKLEHCRAIYAANRSQGRAAVIKLFISQAGCTQAGASTYYHTCNK